MVSKRRGGGRNGSPGRGRGDQRCPPLSASVHLHTHHQPRGTEWLVYVFGRCEKEKIDFQNFLKRWQTPPKCEDWRRLSRTMVSYSEVCHTEQERCHCGVSWGGGRRTSTFLPTLPQHPTKVQGARRKQNHLKRFMQRKHFLDGVCPN